MVLLLHLFGCCSSADVAVVEQHGVISSVGPGEPETGAALLGVSKNCCLGLVWLSGLWSSAGKGIIVSSSLTR
jgi:hypothetical protein